MSGPFDDAFERAAQLARERGDSVVLRQGRWAYADTRTGEQRLGQVEWELWSDRIREFWRAATPTEVVRAYELATHPVFGSRVGEVPC